jgi:hypothetical protein
MALNGKCAYPKGVNAERVDAMELVINHLLFFQGMATGGLMRDEAGQTETLELIRDSALAMIKKLRDEDPNVR